MKKVDVKIDYNRVQSEIYRKNTLLKQLQTRVANQIQSTASSISPLMQTEIVKRQNKHRQAVCVQPVVKYGTGTNFRALRGTGWRRSSNSNTSSGFPNDRDLSNVIINRQTNALYKAMKSVQL
jgi:hypothetical protein